MNVIKKAKRFVKSSKGFMTAKNGYIDYEEWHTAVSSVALMYISPALWAVVLLKLLVDENRRHGSFSEYKQEVPYWLMFGLAVGLLTGFTGRLNTSLISSLITLP